MITDHAFRGDNACLYPTSEEGTCGKAEIQHKESAEPQVTVGPHWFVGIRSCLVCRGHFNNDEHFLSPARIRLVGMR